MISKSVTLISAIAAMGFLAAADSANATPLSIIDTSAPSDNCVFNVSCKVVVSDSVGTFTMAGNQGDGRLQSRTYPGTAPAPAAGDMAYVYRVDLTSMQGLTAVNCVTKLAIDFGPVVELPYSGKPDHDVFVTTSGGLGSVGLSAADQIGTVITFVFSKPVCAGETSYFFGLASRATTPKAGAAELALTLGGTAKTDDRVP